MYNCALLDEKYSISTSPGILALTDGVVFRLDSTIVSQFTDTPQNNKDKKEKEKYAKLNAKGVSHCLYCVSRII